MTKENNCPFTQTEEYLSWHQAVGTKTFYKEFFVSLDGADFQIDVGLSDPEKVLIAFAACVVLELKIGKVLYAPYGPFFITQPTEEEKRKILTELKQLAAREGCVFVRIEDENNYFKNAKHLVHPQKKTFAKEGIFQPRMEWWLDLKNDVESIHNNFHKDHRYSIRRAQKEGIEVEIVEKNLGEYFDIFWNLLKETSERDGFHLYDEKYYKAIFNNHKKELNKFLVFTKLGDKYFSVALVVTSHKIANLVFAGSVSEKRELGFNHLMQWEAIKHSKNIGCEIYNFGGIYENGYGKAGLLGVTNFKKRFGGNAYFHGDFIDIPVKKLRYFMYLLKKFVS